jgi:hypothetical protein
VLLDEREGSLTLKRPEHAAGLRDVERAVRLGRGLGLDGHGLGVALQPAPEPGIDLIGARRLGRVAQRAVIGSSRQAHQGVEEARQFFRTQDMQPIIQKSYNFEQSCPT